MDGKGIRKKGKKKYMQRPTEGKKELIFLLIFLTDDGLSTIVYVNGVYIIGVLYHCSCELCD
jgi:hypothetical protein